MTSTTLPRRHIVDAVASASHGDFVRVELADDFLTVVGSDLTVTTATRIACATTGDPSAVTVPAALLQKTVKALPDGDVAVTVSPSSLRLHCGKFQGEVVAVGRLPDLLVVPAERWRVVCGAEAAQLADALRAVLAAALDDAARPAVSGVRFEVASDSLKVIATDGARLHLRGGGVAGGLVSLTLPCRGVDAVCDALDAAKPAAVKKPKKGEVVAAGAVPPQVAVAVGDRTFAVKVTAAEVERLVYCRRAPEPYCEWQRVAGGEGEGEGVGASLRLPRDVCVAALRQCPADAVTLTAVPSGLRLDYVVTDDTGTRRLGGGSVEVAATSVTVNFLVDSSVNHYGAAVHPAVSALQSITVKVQTRYLLDALAGCDDEVELTITTARPLRLRSGDFSAVVMWMR